MSNRQIQLLAHFRIFLLVFVIASSTLFPTSVLAATTYDIIIHNVLAEPRTGEAAYDVSVFLSVLDENGNPVNDLDIEDFSITEGSKTVEIDSLDLVRDEPNHIILVMDASGSMAGENMNAAREAASGFVQALERGDRVSVLSFTREIRSEIGFTDNREDARRAIDKIQAVPNSDTCLYDAVYEALQKLAIEPEGRRAVVVLTDGVDETFGGKSCSIHTIDDVTDLAVTGRTRAPIYTIGLTNRSDERNLERISALSGGRYRLSATRDDLEDTFDALTEQFRNEYVLCYTSTSPVGTYQLLAEVNHRDSSDQDTHEFDLPDLTADVFFNAPASGVELNGPFTVEAGATALNQIKEVIFRINDTDVGTANSAPFRLEYDFSLLSPGEYTLTVIARGFNDQELAQESIPVSVIAAGAPTNEAQEAEQQVEEPLTATPLPTATPQPSGLNLSSETLLLVGVGVLVLLGLIVAVAVFLIVSARRHKQNAVEQPQVQPADDRTVNFAPAHTPAAPQKAHHPSGQLAVLRVLASEDPMMVGQMINITKACITIGRGADNDVVLSGDKAVSRQHAMIEMTGTEFFLSEFITQEANGSVKRPTYGTFVNEQKVGAIPVQLKSGDEIQLGTRLKLHFDRLDNAFKPRSGGDKTLEDLGRDDDKTMIM